MDPITGQVLAEAAGPLVGGVFGMTGAQQANASQRQMFDSAQQFNQSEAQRLS